MKNKILIIGAGAALMAMSSCSIFHSSKSTSQSYSRDSLSKTNTIESSIDTGKTVIKEVADEVFYSPGLNASKSFPIKAADLFKSLSTNLYRLDTGMLKIGVGYDTLSHALKINVEKLPEAGNKHTEKTTTVQNGKIDNKQVNQQTQVKVKTAAAASEKKPDYGWIWSLAGIIGILLAVLFIYNKISTGNFLSSLFKRK